MRCGSLMRDLEWMARSRKGGTYRIMDLEWMARGRKGGTYRIMDLEWMARGRKGGTYRIMMNVIRKYMLRTYGQMKRHAFNRIICMALLGSWTCIWPKTNDYEDSL